MFNIYGFPKMKDFIAPEDFEEARKARQAEEMARLAEEEEKRKEKEKQALLERMALKEEQQRIAEEKRKKEEERKKREAILSESPTFLNLKDEEIYGKKKKQKEEEEKRINPEFIHVPYDLFYYYEQNDELLKSYLSSINKSKNPSESNSGTVMSAGSVNADSQDSLYDDVVEFVKAQQKASTSLLQRRFGIGYNRAARLIDTLEDRGIIGPANGSKPREVYIK